MPTVLRLGPCRFFLHNSDGGEPPHVHAERGEAEANFWLDPVRLERSTGFPARELRAIGKEVAAHRDELLEAWNGFFGP